MSKKSVKVAITGSIGSGKTTFSKLIEDKGYPVLFADDISKELLENDKTVKNKVIKIFGDSVYRSGKLNKKFLAKTIFSDPSKVNRINSILHPVVIKKISKQMEDLSAQYNFIFVEAALIYEADMENLFDYVVLVSADRNKRLKRLAKSKRISEKDFEQREANQISDDEKMKRADFIFLNNGTKSRLKEKVNLLLLMLNSLS